MGLLGHPLIVCHHYYSGAEIRIELQENVHDLVAHMAVQVARWFIRKNDVRSAHNGPGNGNALLLPAGELVREVGCPITKTYMSQRFQR